MKHRFLLTIACMIFFASATYLAAQPVFTGTLTGHQEVLPVPTWGEGEVQATLDGDTLILQGFFENLTSEVDTLIAGGAHIHLGYAGQNGPVQFPLTIDLEPSLQNGIFPADKNRFTLSGEQKDALMNRRLYVNVHTLNFPGGELRAQLLPPADTYYTATLLGSQEVPPVRSGSSGALIMELTEDTLYVSGSFSGLEADLATNIAGGAHLHNAGVGSNGGVIIPINSEAAGDLRSAVFLADSNRYVLTEEQKEMFRTRQIYANIHSTMYTSGELRGQVAGMAKSVFYAHLTGTQENPSVMTNARGVIMAELSADEILTLHGSFQGLESDFAAQIAGGSHIHSAQAGQNGGVIFALNADPSIGLRMADYSIDSNSYALDPDQVDMLFSRGLYVNVHSMQFTSGEIRGQLLPESQGFFMARLGSIYTTPNVPTTAEGLVMGELNGGVIRLSGTFNGLKSPLAVDIAGGSHIHAAMAGRTGPVIIPLQANLSPDSLSGAYDALMNTYAIDGLQREALLDRGLYINVHSKRNPSGEIRGQLLPISNMLFVGNLSGASHTPPIRTRANGLVITEVNGPNAIVHGTFNSLSSNFAANIAGGAHIHAGMAGQNGGVIIPLNSEVDTTRRNGVFLADSNRYDFSAGMLDTLRQRGYYVNVHSEDTPSGEIRGQALPTATAHFTSTLSGRNEVPDNFSLANGAMKLELNGTFLTASGAFGVLTEDLDTSIAGGSHIHSAFAGNNAGIAYGLTPQFGDENMRSGVYLNGDNRFELDMAEMTRLFAGGFYVNLHTSAYPAGELRGQVLPEPNAFPSGEASITAPADGSLITLEGDTSTQFVVSWSAADDRDTLAYLWELSLDPNFSVVLGAMHTAQDRGFQLSYGMLDEMLETFGVEPGDTAALYHRPIASDGSLRTPGESAMVSLVRGFTDATADFAKLGVNYQVFPTLRAEPSDMYLDISSDYTGPATCRIVDMQGQVVYSKAISLQTGEQRFTLEQVPYTPGLFACVLELEGERGPAVLVLMQ